MKNDKDKQIAALSKSLWWQERKFKARESYLLYRIEQLEKQLKESNK